MSLVQSRDYFYPYDKESTKASSRIQKIGSGGTGTKGAAITPLYENDNSQAAVTTCANTHTVTPTTISIALRQAALGAAIGSGVIWTFGGGRTEGLIIPNSTTDGMGIVTIGTGQICDINFTWDE